ncbi:MAG: DNA-formamidopyrimidine glycosylase [Chloroflexota bacterium]
MPELPEVETIVRALVNGNKETPGIVGKTILGVDIRWEGTIEEPDIDQFIRRIDGQRIEAIGRRAKYLVFTLSEDTLLVHLRMSGAMLIGPQGVDLAKHVRVAILLEDDLQLAFNNPRKFGRMWLLADPEEKFRKLGPEPLNGDLDAEKFTKKLLARSRQLKPLLLDQSFIAGLGNIYVDESLHLAKLHPLRLANSLQPEEGRELFRAVQNTLNEGIRQNGASIDWVYRGGEFQNQFRVYQQTDQPCLVCGTPISRITVGQRGTHFCPRCQLIPEED